MASETYGGTITITGGTDTGRFREAIQEMWIGEEHDKAGSWKTDMDVYTDLWTPGVSTGLVLDDAINAASGEKRFTYKVNQKVCLQKYKNPVLYIRILPSTAWSDATNAAINMYFEYETQTTAIGMHMSAYREEFASATKFVLTLGNKLIISVFAFGGTANYLNKVLLTNLRTGKKYVDRSTLEEVYALHMNYARYKTGSPSQTPTTYLVDQVAVPYWPARECVMEASTAMTLITYSIGVQAVKG
jgi:hypothetical protein